MSTKCCKKCNLNKNYNDFTKRSRSKDGYRNVCKECRADLNKTAYYKPKTNRLPCTLCAADRNLDRQRVHRELCSCCYRTQERARKLLDKTRLCSSCSTDTSIKWYAGSLCRSCFRNHNYAKNKALKNDNYKIDRLKNNLRARISKIVSGAVKVGSAVKDLGCTIDEFKLYIESKFEPGMTWNNYGHRTWHIDHIQPLASFDLTLPEELKKACHYTNLQPLWAKDNLSKSDKWRK
jgi:hypothetical protein